MQDVGQTPYWKKTFLAVTRQCLSDFHEIVYVDQNPTVNAVTVESQKNSNLWQAVLVYDVYLLISRIIH